MTKFIFILTFFFLAFVGQAQGRVFLSHCGESGLQHCVNQNFYQVKKEAKVLWLFLCHNGSARTSTPQFTRCIQTNFLEIGRKLDGMPYLSYCHNPPFRKFSWDFIRCINDNFRRVENYLNIRQ